MCQPLNQETTYVNSMKLKLSVTDSSITVILRQYDTESPIKEPIAMNYCLAACIELLRQLAPSLAGEG